MALVTFFGAYLACAIAGPCRLPSLLHEVLAAFLGVLDRATLADLITSGRVVMVRRLELPNDTAAKPQRISTSRK